MPRAWEITVSDDAVMMPVRLPTFRFLHSKFRNSVSISTRGRKRGYKKKHKVVLFFEWVGGGVLQHFGGNQTLNNWLRVMC